MIICISGKPDIGKYELAKALQNHFYFRSPDSVIPVHISRFSGFESPRHYHEQISKIHYKDMFNIMRLNIHHDRIRIMSGCHLDEYVHGSLDRGHNTNWVFDMENEYKDYLNHIMHITLVSSYNSLDEYDCAFLEAAQKTIIPSKLILDIDAGVDKVIQKSIAFIRGKL